VHGAAIEVKSVEGEGSVFSVTFPLRRGRMVGGDVLTAAVK
jgi:signal transduction histidine kinase